MKKINFIAIAIAVVLFVIPFFWLKPGLVDLGGDAGRLYFVAPSAVAQNLFQRQNLSGALLYAMIPYELYLSFLSKFITSPTLLIAFEHGLQLSLSFFILYRIVTQILSKSSERRDEKVDWAGIVSGIVYVGFITKTGWITALETQNEVFLYPALFYLLLQFCETRKFFYRVAILVLTLLYSGNFGFSNSPALMAFFPLTLIFLILYVKLIRHTAVPWAGLLSLAALAIGLHSFHLVPSVAAVLDPGTILHSYIFSATTKFANGVNYFDAIHADLGKLSWELFQPATWNGQTVLILFIPLIALLGFLRKPFKLLALTGAFFALTFFLVSANITLIGVKIYKHLFYLPGFMMFRSFYEKWYYVYVFFFTLVFALSFFRLTYKAKRFVAGLLGCIVIVSIVWRITPFLEGALYKGVLHQSNNIPIAFDMDPDLLPALSFAKALPDDGNFLTVPLTLPYYQVVMGGTVGAYVGVSMVGAIADKKDIAGFWSFGPYKQAALSAFENADSKQLLQLLSLSNIRYVFRDTDQRIMDAFPLFPFYRYDMLIDIPTLDSQKSYDAFFGGLPLTTLYEKGYFRIQKLDDSVVRPTVYIPDVIYASQSGALSGSSYQSAYLDDAICKEFSQISEVCNTPVTHIPNISFIRRSAEEYDIHIDLGRQTIPFLIVLSDDFHSSWELTFDGAKNSGGVRHVMVNGYANGWIIDPGVAGITGKVTGHIRLGFQRYFIAGNILSAGTAAIFIVFVLYKCLRRKNEK